MRDSGTLLELRRRITGIEGSRAPDSGEVVPLGHAGIDARLHGGIERGRLHEVFAQEEEDVGSAAGFAAMLAACLVRAGGALVWLREEQVEARGALHAPGLAELGVDPGRLILGLMPDPLALLRVAAEMARCADVGAVVIELWRNPRVLDLTASRRLAVAAEGSGVTALMLRLHAEPGPSAAHTRWEIGAAPAVPLEADAPGYPTLDIVLSRQRGGRAGGRWQLEWDREEAAFREPGFGRARTDAKFDGEEPDGAALSGDMVPVPPGGPAPPPRRRA